MNPKPTLTGTVHENGTWTVPKNNVVFPNMSLDGGITARFVATHDWTGSINPITGAAQIRARLQDHDLGLDPPRRLLDRHGQRAGRPQPGDHGHERLHHGHALRRGQRPHDDREQHGRRPRIERLRHRRRHRERHARPAVALGPERGALRAAVRPDPQARHRREHDRRRPRAASRRSPSTSTAPPASPRPARRSTGTSATARSPATTRTASRTYTAPGTYTAKLRIVDDGPDEDTVQIPITVTGRPDLTIAKSKSGDFRAGNNVTYDIDVANQGLGPAGTVTVTDTLPTGVQYVSASATGWTCGAVAQVVTCTRPSLANGRERADDHAQHQGAAHRAGPGDERRERRDRQRDGDREQHLRRRSRRT